MPGYVLAFDSLSRILTLFQSSSTGVTEMSQPEFSLLSELQDVFSDCTYMIRCGTECAGQR